MRLHVFMCPVRTMLWTVAALILLLSRLCLSDGCPIRQVLEVQVPGKRAMAAGNFVNGLKGRTLTWQPVQQPVTA